MNTSGTFDSGFTRSEVGWLDYSTFGLMLGFSALIGAYFGSCGKKEDTLKEYVHGGKTLSIIPVAMSLITSNLSGIAVIGTATEIYVFGIVFCISIVCIPFVSIIYDYFYLPVFYELQITSIYEYLELRFNRNVRLLASALKILVALLYIPIVIYVPALVINQVCGMNLYVTITSISAICIFYTMVGGIKAVVWTDFLQGVFLFLACIVTVIMGIIHVGGLTNIWEINKEGGRLQLFDFNPSPFVRISTWTCLIGNTVNWVGNLVGQGFLQKYMSVSSLSKARKAHAMHMAGFAILVVFFMFFGVLMYAAYYDCDPIKAKFVRKPDQILTYYIMDVTRRAPGFIGLFVAGILSASLSSMSSVFNSTGTIFFEDFMGSCLKKNASDKTKSRIVKILVLIVGILTMGGAFIIDKMGNVLQLTYSLGSVAGGPLLGLFSLGIFFPRANSKGCLAGSITSLLVMSWLIFGAQIAKLQGRYKHHPLPTSIKGCTLNGTVSYSTQSRDIDNYQEDVSILFKISFMYYKTLSTFIVLTVGMIVSLLTEPPRTENIHPTLITPILRKYVRKNINRYERCAQMEKEKSTTI